jgi:ElaB/YqjD/DUF883 family membrane-anchored ribosome-binding protein
MNHATTSNGYRTHELRKHARVVRKDLHELGSLSRKAAKAKVQQFGENVSGYVRENPMKSVLIATATGAILGAVWSRRR